METNGQERIKKPSPYWTAEKEAPFEKKTQKTQDTAFGFHKDNSKEKKADTWALPYRERDRDVTSNSCSYKTATMPDNWITPAENPICQYQDANTLHTKSCTQNKIMAQEQSVNGLKYRKGLLMVKLKNSIEDSEREHNGVQRFSQNILQDKGSSWDHHTTVMMRPMKHFPSIEMDKFWTTRREWLLTDQLQARRGAQDHIS